MLGPQDQADQNSLPQRHSKPDGGGRCDASVTRDTIQGSKGLEEPKAGLLTSAGVREGGRRCWVEVTVKDPSVRSRRSGLRYHVTTGMRAWRWYLRMSHGAAREVRVAVG